VLHLDEVKMPFQVGPDLGQLVIERLLVGRTRKYRLTSLIPIEGAQPDTG
jgi:hypothetical protein